MTLDDYIVKMRESAGGIWTPKLEQDLREGAERTCERAAECNPYVGAFGRLEAAERKFATEGASAIGCTTDILTYDDDIVCTEADFWREKLGLACSDGEVWAVHNGVLRQWRQDLERLFVVWKAQCVDEELARLRRGNRKRLAILAKACEELGVAAGCGFEPGELIRSEMAPIREMLLMMQKDKELMRICELIGRSIGEVAGESRQVVETHVAGCQQVHDEDLNEELSGVVLGRSIEDALPSELSACGDPELETLFDLKFIEGRLLSFAKEGVWSSDLNAEDSELEQRDDECCQGPIVICVDTSGSMSGAPEQVAKAVALAVILKARSAGRRCYLVLTSVKSIEMDVSAGTGWSEVLSFVLSSFNGGTDGEEMIDSVISAMERIGYEESDALLISDMNFGSRIKSMQKKMADRRARGNRFFGLGVKGNGLLGLTAMRLIFGDRHLGFDELWWYDAGAKEICEASDSVRRVTRHTDD